MINNSGSATALKQFNRLNAHKTMINLVINDTVTAPTNRLGLHAPHGTRPDGSKGALNFPPPGGGNNFEGQADIVKDANGNEVYAEATITIFEGNIRASYGNNTQAIEDEMVVTFGHEAEHDLDLKQVQATKTHTGSDAIYHAQNPNGTWATGSPYWVGATIRREITQARDERILRSVQCIHGTCDKP